ncbi:AAA family ATPase [Aestuariispira ectoiniformans]|uniref:AAA family ATPase n=1 Tax=Aestuariispira ectoiniformans TaxID=2775080 RepID=UPI00223B9CE9|nr:AAA family ATPase [Aestuariispira ectoiniformans]
MRLKSFHGQTLSEAMAQVREQLGPDAIIVATQEADGAAGARVTAAIDEEEHDLPEQGGDLPLEKQEQLTIYLDRHGVPRWLGDRIVETASGGPDETVEEALKRALDQLFSFSPLPLGKGKRPIMLIGPPGTGKTVTCAKLAARQILDGKKAVLIAADPVRLTATDQLAAYAERLGVPMFEAPTAEALRDALSRCHDQEAVFIDTPGTNPFNLEELAYLVEIAEASRAAPVLVLNAGRDADETIDIARAFRPVGPKHLLSTGLDITHRLGSLLSVAYGAELAFCDHSATPNIANGLTATTSDHLAQRLIALGNTLEEAKPLSLSDDSEA